MLPATLRVTLVVVLVLYFIILFVFLKKRSIELRYTLLWILCGILMALMLLSPSGFTALINLLGITGTMNGLFLMFIALLIMICMSLTAIVSAQSRKLRALIQQMAIMDRKLQEMEKEQGKKDSL